jgi:putative ABC transport system ATP-binding protein
MSVAAEQPEKTEFDVSHVTLTYPARSGSPAATILENVTFRIARGSTLTIVGPSGSGKSTLLRCLNRLEEPASGTVSFRGQDICAMDPLLLRRRVALVQQTPVLFEGSVRRNLQTQPPRAGIDLSEPRLARALSEVGLDSRFLDRATDALSGGEKQRVTIARALLAEPDALLLDEPTASLDPPNAALVVDTVSNLQRTRGLTIVAVTHQVEFLRRLGGWILYLERGQVRGHERVDGERLVEDPAIQAFLSGQSPVQRP